MTIRNPLYGFPWTNSRDDSQDNSYLLDFQVKTTSLLSPTPPTPIYEGRLFVLFCLYLWEIHQTNWDASGPVLGLFGKLSRRRGACAWFHGVWTCGVKVLEYWMIFSLKIELNCSWKFQRNRNVPLVLLERSLLDEQDFKQNLFGKIWIQNVGDIDFYVIY